jgi:hypothetical protein
MLNFIKSLYQNIALEELSPFLTCGIAEYTQKPMQDNPKLFLT